MTKQRGAYPELVMPPNLTRSSVKVWSSGISLDADVYRPRGAENGRSAPAIVLSHGWGGTKATCERYAALFAANGFIALTFTHAGWGDSESLGPRELVDPLQWIQSFRSAVDFLEGEPGVDRERLAAWGTSFGGGIAMYNAAHDARLKVLAVQVAMVSTFYGPGGVVQARERAIELARGQLGPHPTDTVPGLPGTYHLPHALQYDVVETIGNLTAPTLLLDAQNEGFFDRAAHCGRVYETLQARHVPVRYQVIPGIDHYGIYFEGYDEGSSAALSWFREHL